eukprot:147243-Pyramimonas_sp.AAC.1
MRRYAKALMSRQQRDVLCPPVRKVLRRKQLTPWTFNGSSWGHYQGEAAGAQGRRDAARLRSAGT